MAWGTEYLQWATWENVKAFAESNFVSGMFASLAGAYFGASAAYKLSERGKRRDDLKAELENVNAAIHRCHAVFSSFVNLKRQHVASLKYLYASSRAAVLAHKQGIANGTIAAGTPLAVQFDFRLLSPLRLDTAGLQGSVLEKTKAKGRPRSMIQVLANSVGSVDDMITARNDFVSYQRNTNLSANDRVALVFGLPIAGERIDTSYGDYVEGIFAQTDDCIYFSQRLCLDLEAYGTKVREELLKVAKGEVPNVTKVDFSSIPEPELLPDVTAYETWENGFPEVPPVMRRGPLQRMWHWKLSMLEKLFQKFRARPDDAAA